MGLSTQVSLMRPSRTAAIGVLNGTLDMFSATEAPMQAEDVGVVLLVGREHEASDLRLVHEAVREERTHGPVDLARREDLLLAGATLPLEEPARDLPGRVALLTVLHRQGKERKVGGVILHRDGAQHHRVSVLHEARAMCKLGHAADF